MRYGRRHPVGSIRHLLIPSWCEICVRLEYTMILLAEHLVTVAIASETKKIMSQIFFSINIKAQSHLQKLNICKSTVAQCF